MALSAGSKKIYEMYRGKNRVSSAYLGANKCFSNGIVITKESNLGITEENINVNSGYFENKGYNKLKISVTFERASNYAETLAFSGSGYVEYTTGTPLDEASFPTLRIESSVNDPAKGEIILDVPADKPRLRGVVEFKILHLKNDKRRYKYKVKFYAYSEGTKDDDEEEETPAATIDENGVLVFNTPPTIDENGVLIFNDPPTMDSSGTIIFK